MKKIGVICYSPTGSTRKICQAVASGIPGSAVKVLDLTLPVQRAGWLDRAETVIREMDHLVVGVPVYAGKIPVLARGFLERIPGSDLTATAVVVYGNKDYGIALADLAVLLTHKGFKIINAGAFIGQHTYGGDPPVAPGRPDREDLEIAESWGAAMNLWTDPLESGLIPREPNIFTRIKSEMALRPTHIPSACLRCGICAEQCPVGIIDSKTGAFLSDEAMKRCQGCLACVKNCPNEGSVFRVTPLQRMMGRAVLASAARRRREPVMVP